MDLISTAALSIVLANLILGVILWLQVRKLYSYPGLWGFPVFGNLFYFYRTLFLTFMDSMDKYMVKITEKYGKNGICFHWIYGFRKVAIISSPHLVKELANHPNLAGKPESMYGGFGVYVDGPFASSRSDDLWKTKRKEYNSCLKRSHVYRDYSTTFIKCSYKLIDMMLASPSAVDSNHVVSGIVQNASVESLFGVETSLVYHPENVRTMAQVTTIGSFIMANPKLAGILLSMLKRIEPLLFGKFSELKQLVVADIEKRLLLKDTLEEYSIPNQIASRIRKQDRNQSLLPEIRELFITAVSTVVSSLSSAIIFLALQPDIQERAWKEQDEIFGNDSRDPTNEDIEMMLFLDRFIKESLRFSSPPFIGKVAAGDTNADGITIPNGTVVIFLMRYMRMDPKYWKNPKAFDPDRFLDESEILKNAYTPFGIGVRRCPGMNYAILLMKIIISKLLRTLKIRPVDEAFRFEDIQYELCIGSEITNPPLLQVEKRT